MLAYFIMSHCRKHRTSFGHTDLTRRFEGNRLGVNVFISNFFQSFKAVKRAERKNQEAEAAKPSGSSPELPKKREEPESTFAEEDEPDAKKRKSRFDGVFDPRNAAESKVILPTAEHPNIDFLGEGTEEKLTGKLHAFRRGVTRYPVPGALVYPATTADLKQVYASDGRSSITIGKVYPTKDIRAGVYVDVRLCTVHELCPLAGV